GWLDWWHQLSAPPEAPLGASFEVRERLRRGRLASTLMLGLVVISLFALPVGLSDPPTLVALILFQGAFIVAAVLNRRGYVNTAGIVIVVISDIGIGQTFLGAPGGRLDLSYVPLYDLLVLSELFAVTVLPPISVFPVAVANSAFVVADLL